QQLKPGEQIAIEARDAAADAVRVRRRNTEQITLGTRAASKLLVEVVGGALLLLALGGAAGAGWRPGFEVVSSRVDGVA
ncbi:hypothetical protein, partial [Salmonella sp. SAL4443]|uniref:hypothetical protein n=1 Tax=Salmonella sp. SAL4443 TaxID=3159898 RepID=UPI00397DA069